jgi:transcriptional regulator with XRE-family HTH domain
MKRKEEFLKVFGKHLQKTRKAKGLSIREAELKGDVTRQFLSDVENGKVNFTFYNLKKLLMCWIWISRNYSETSEIGNIRLAVL